MNEVAKLENSKNNTKSILETNWMARQKKPLNHISIYNAPSTS